MPTEGSKSFGLVIGGVGEEELGFVLYGNQNVSGLLPVITEIVVILNHLGVIYLMKKMTKYVTAQPPSSAKNEQ